MGIQTNYPLSAFPFWMPPPRANTSAAVSAVLKLDDLARKAGVTLYPQIDFDDFNTAMRANKDRRGYLNPIFDEPPAGQAFWIAGIAEDKALLTTQAGRLYDWRDTNLLREAQSLRLYYPNGRGARAPHGESVEMGCPSAENITGQVLFSGGIWIRPDLTGVRPEIGCRLSQVLARVTRYCGFLHWPLDYIISSISADLYAKGIANAYGQPHVEPGIKIAMQFMGEGGAVLLWSDRKDIERDIERTLAGDLTSPRGAVG